MGITVSMQGDFLLPSPRFGDDAVALVDSVPTDPHLRYLFGNFEEMHPREFYRELFPSGELDVEGEFNKGRYTAIAVRIFEDEGKVHRYSVCDDLRVIDELAGCNEFCVMSPVSYAGKSQRQANARKLYAVVFDLDGLLVTKDGRSKALINIFNHVDLGLIPRPSHIVFSGTGLHLYYMLEQPLPLFPNVMRSLSAYRSRMVPKLWNRYVSSLSENPQFESVTQGFRMVGTKAKNGRTARAFKVGDKVTVDYLNRFVNDEESKISQVKYVSKTPMSVAREKWPEWHQARIVEGRPRGTWEVKRDLYDWWKRKIEEGATVGHRYFCVMALAVYAMKCGVSYDELESDAIGLVPHLNGLDKEGDKPFTVEDVVKALEAYDADYITFPRHTIEEISGIDMPANKRNGRRQAIHLKGARAIQQINDDANGTNWRDGNGRKPKRDLIRGYAVKHPDQNHSEIARALGVSRPTVIKWLKPGWREEWRHAIRLGEEVAVRRDGQGLASVDGSRRFSAYGEPEWGWWVEVAEDGSELRGLWEFWDEDGLAVRMCV